jgi:hypothetical protein
MTVILGMVFTISAVVVGLTVAFFGYLLLLQRRGNPAAGIICVAAAPVFTSAHVLAWAGGISGLLLNVILNQSSIRTIVTIIAILMLAYAVVRAVQTIHIHRMVRLHNRTISQDEMLNLIESCAISSFSKRAGTVDFGYTNPGSGKGRDFWRPHRADATGYPAYVAAANEVRSRCRITYNNDTGPNDPSSPGHRWITQEEASALLNAGKIRTFSYGQPDTFARLAFSGHPTGIKLVDYGWVHHIGVDAAMESTMIPIARTAQTRHGAPQFCVNGHYEPIVNPER